MSGNCIRQHGDVYHEAYDLGNHRLSCALCVLASLNDLINGAVHNPDTYREILPHRSCDRLQLSQRLLAE